MRRFDEGVDVDDAGGLVEDAFQLRRKLVPPRPVRSVDFGDERLEDRGTGRYFGNLDRRAEALAIGSSRSRTRRAIV
jgi:hypothetical protein